MDTVCRKPLKLPPLCGDNISICLIIDGGGVPPDCDQHLSIPVYLSHIQSHTRGIGVRMWLIYR